MFNTEHIEKRWAAVLDHKNVAPIKDKTRRSVVAQLLENTQVALKEEHAAKGGFIAEDGTTLASIDRYDPVLISLVRRAMPQLIAFDIAGVQPMTQPTGLIFAMKSLYKSASDGDGTQTTTAGDEALFNRPDTAFSGDQVAADGTALAAATGEALSGGRSAAGSNGGFGEMGFEIVKTSVEAKTRALRATYTTELAQDLKAVHGLDAESELANILSTEILAEMNREIIDGVNNAAKTGAFAGDFDLNDSNENLGARWGVEKFKALIFEMHKESNQIGIETRRGKGNFAIVSSNVASALSAAGMLDSGSNALNTLEVDSTGNLLAGTLAGGIKVFVDPFAASDYVTIGYRGSNVYDAGVFYCPYIPLTMMRAIGEDDFQPRIGFKTRYGIRANPFVSYPTSGYPEGAGELRFGGAGNNQYFRNFTVTGL